MTVTAVFRWLVGRASASRHLRQACLATGLAFSFFSPAYAQLAGSVGIDSDYRSRGYSLTGENAAVWAQFSYDHHSGAYGSLAAIAMIDEEPKLLGGIANIGYARRLGPRVTIDLGLLRSQIGSAYRYGRGYDYTEVYAGAAVGRVTGRVHYSPDYRSDGVSTLYAEIEAGVEPAADWVVSGHAGLLVYLSADDYWRSGSTHRDWRFSLARQMGRFELHAAVSGGGPRAQYYYYGERKQTALTLGGSIAF